MPNTQSPTRGEVWFRVTFNKTEGRPKASEKVLTYDEYLALSEYEVRATHAELIWDGQEVAR